MKNENKKEEEKSKYTMVVVDYFKESKKILSCSLRAILSKLDHELPNDGINDPGGFLSAIKTEKPVYVWLQTITENEVAVKRIVKWDLSLVSTPKFAMTQERKQEEK